MLYLDIIGSLIAVIYVLKNRQAIVGDIRRLPLDQAIAVGLFAGLLGLMLGYAGYVILASLNVLWALFATACGFMGRGQQKKRRNARV